jgi:hypothetical protein
MVCAGKEISVCWGADWCVLGRRLMCAGKEINV